MVGSNTPSYTWDIENRLSSVTLSGTGGTVSFRYDPFGRRIYKASSSGTSIYAYEGDNLIEETNSSGGVVARYAETDNIDEPLSSSTPTIGRHSNLITGRRTRVLNPNSSNGLSLGAVPPCCLWNT